MLMFDSLKNKPSPSDVRWIQFKMAARQLDGMLGRGEIGFERHMELETALAYALGYENDEEFVEELSKHWD